MRVQVWILQLYSSQVLFMSTGTWVRVLEYEYEYYNSVVVKYLLWVRVLEYEYLSTSMNITTL